MKWWSKQSVRSGGLERVWARGRDVPWGAPDETFRITLTLDATRTLWMSSSRTESRSSVTLAPGFSMMSMTPSSRACAPSSFCRRLKELKTTIGVGLNAMICSAASSPPRRGILMSMVTTSGDKSRVISIAWKPSRAIPATSMSGVCSNISAMRPLHVAGVFNDQNSNWQCVTRRSAGRKTKINGLSLRDILVAPS